MLEWDAYYWRLVSCDSVAVLQLVVSPLLATVLLLVEPVEQHRLLGLVPRFGLANT